MERSEKAPIVGRQLRLFFLCLTRLSAKIPSLFDIGRTSKLSSSTSRIRSLEKLMIADPVILTCWNRLWV